MKFSPMEQKIKKQEKKLNETDKSDVKFICYTT